MNDTRLLYMARYTLNMAATKLKEIPDLDVKKTQDMLVAKRQGGQAYFVRVIDNETNGVCGVNIEMGRQDGQNLYGEMRIWMDEAISRYGEDRFAPYVCERIIGYLTKETAISEKNAFFCKKSVPFGQKVVIL